MSYPYVIIDAFNYNLILAIESTKEFSLVVRDGNPTIKSNQMVCIMSSSTEETNTLLTITQPILQVLELVHSVELLDPFYFALICLSFDPKTKITHWSIRSTDELYEQDFSSIGDLQAIYQPLMDGIYRLQQARKALLPPSTPRAL